MLGPVQANTTLLVAVVVPPMGEVRTAAGGRAVPGVENDAGPAQLPPPLAFDPCAYQVRLVPPGNTNVPVVQVPPPLHPSSVGV